MQSKIRNWMAQSLPGLGWIVCSLAALFYCYEYLLRIEPSVMINPLMREFSITAGGLGFLVALYYYAYTPLQAVVGVLTDYFGPRKVLLSAIVSCAFGAWLFGMAHHELLAGVGRIFIGIGSAFAFVGVMKLSAEWLPKRYFAIFAGITTSLGMLGGMFGDVELTKMVSHYGWHHIMSLSVVVGAMLFVMFWMFVYNSKNPKQRRKLNTPRRTWRFFAASFMRMFVNRQLIITGLIGCVLYTSLTVVAEMWGIPYLSALTHNNQVLAAHLNSMIFLGWLIGSPLTGLFSNAIRSRRVPMMLGCFMSAVLMSTLLFLHPQQTWVIATILFFIGIFSSAEILVFVIAREEVEDSLVATAVGFINLLVMLGGMLIQPWVGKLLDMAWQGKIENHIHVYSLEAYSHALYVVPALLIVAMVLVTFLKESYQND